jgi:biotin transport system substrate-specific component
LLDFPNVDGENTPNTKNEFPSEERQMSRETTLSQAILGRETLLYKALLVLGGSVFIAVSAQVSIPMIPVPITLQTLAILMVGFAFGSRLGALTALVYLAEGFMGLPVFANGANGAAFAGPTAGFLLGFVPMAYLAGLASEGGLAKGLIGTAVSAVAISALLYIPGVLFLATFLSLDLSTAFSAAAAPFLLGDFVKSILAALIVTGAWARLRKS